MKIVLVANYPADGQPSMLRYAAFLERELKRAGHEVKVIWPRVLVRRLVTSSDRFGKWLGYVDKFLLFRIGFSRRIRGADIVHVCDHSNSIYLSWIKTGTKIITCHDALAIRSALDHFPQNSTGLSGKTLQRWTRKSLRHADGIIYVSQKTRFDFEQLLGIEVPYEVISHALNWPYRAAADAEVDSVLEPLGLNRNGYILHVGGNSWYKNRLGVLQMFAQLRRDERFRSLSLVMVGRPLTDEMLAWCREKGLTDVYELQKVDNAQLRVLYTGAFALLFPSLEEGFGWPVLEAQACGCPVITSARLPMTEIAGEGAMLVDPLNGESILGAVAACSENREALVEAGFRNLERFSPQTMIRRYEDFYRATLETKEMASAPAALRA
jgi:glycosyltransferase involved in cell wall biosynthesis